MVGGVTGLTVEMVARARAATREAGAGDVDAAAGAEAGAPASREEASAICIGVAARAVRAVRGLKRAVFSCTVF